jgi:hypothetical protein
VPDRHRRTNLELSRGGNFKQHEDPAVIWISGLELTYGYVGYGKLLIVVHVIFEFPTSDDSYNIEDKP